MHWSKFWGMIYLYLYIILAPIVRRRHYCAQVDILQNLKVETISTGRFHVFRTWKEDESLLSTKHLCLWTEETHFQVVTNIGKKVRSCCFLQLMTCVHEDDGLYVNESNSLRNVLDILTSTFLALAHSKRVFTILKYLRYHWYCINDTVSLIPYQSITKRAPISVFFNKKREPDCFCNLYPCWTTRVSHKILGCSHRFCRRCTAFSLRMSMRIT